MTKKQIIDGKELAALGTGLLSDALQALGRRGGRLAGIRPLPGAAPFAGPALPVVLAPAGGSREVVHLGARALASAAPGAVLVMDNGGRGEAACFGGLMAAAAARARLAGAVVHGAVRDVEEIAAAGLPVHAASTHPASARGRFVEVGAGPAVVTGAVIRPGDWIVADATGIVVIPADLLEPVRSAARGIRRREEALATEIRRGGSPVEVLGAAYEGLVREKARDAGAAPESLSACTVSDAMDLLGLEGACDGLAPRSGSGPAAGPAFTVRYEPAGESGAGTVGDFLDDVPAGSVAVLDNGGRAGCTVWGGILSRAAALRGISGTVIDGACRDVEESRSLGFPLFSRAVHARTGKGRVQVAAVNGPVTLGGLEVEPGDWIHGDGSGVVRVPASRRDEVMRTAAEIARAEREVLRHLGEGCSLAEARSQAGYHRIRRRPGGTGSGGPGGSPGGSDAA